MIAASGNGGSALLYHHGIRHRPDLALLRADWHAWFDQAPLPQTAREQVTVALQMIDLLDRQLPTLDRHLRVCPPPDRLQGADGPLRDR
jgi:hypothetical protein